MANLPIKNPPEFSGSVRAINTTDRGHPDTFNPQLETLINNDVYLNSRDAYLEVVLQGAKEASETHMGDAGIHVTELQKQAWGDKAEKTPVSETGNGLMLAADKAKLDGVAAGAEVNQNALSSIKAGGVTVAANTKTALVEFAAGDNITITADNATKKVTVTATVSGEFAATLSTAWAGSSPPYTQTAAVAGLRSADKAFVDVVAANTAQEKAWGCVSRITTADGSITAYCNKKKPATAIPLQIKAVR